MIFWPNQPIWASGVYDSLRAQYQWDFHRVSRAAGPKMTNRTLSVAVFNCRGRHGHCWTAPRTDPCMRVYAYGSYRGWMASKRLSE
jgi:hypothetical protein